MPYEDDVRRAFRTLADQAADTASVLAAIQDRLTAGRDRQHRAWRVPRQAGPGSSRALLAAFAAAAAVIVVVAAAAAVSSGARAPAPAVRPKAPAPAVRARAPAPAVPADRPDRCPGVNVTSVPLYYLTTGGAIKDRLTGAQVATVRPPKPFNTIEAVTGADNDRTFVLAAQAGNVEGEGIARLFIARFNPADATVSVTALPAPEIPATSLLTGLALSPDGARLATAVQGGGNRSEAVVSVYSLTGGKVKVWQDTGTVGSSPYDVGAISWSCGGTLAFFWEPGEPAGDGLWLLNTATTGGQLLADSRYVLHGWGDIYDGFDTTWDAALTPDGTTIVAPMTRTMRTSVEQEFGEFSAATGKPIATMYLMRGPFRGADEMLVWTNSSGSVLVVGAPPGPGKDTVYGILSGNHFVPIPGAPPVADDIPTIAF
jgi:hypothetical protein